MWPDPRLCDLMKIEQPIIQAPMAGAATPALTAAVSNAGGLGSLGCAEMSVDQLRAAAVTLRGATERPFNLNFFIQEAPRTEPAVLEAARQRLAPWYTAAGLGTPPESLPELGPCFDDARLALLLEIRPAVVSFHFGLPALDAILALKDAGIVVISTATTVAEARALERAGVDAVIAQGYEAGGHRGSHRPTPPGAGVGTLALVPQVVDAVGVPVIAAGGIGDGRGIAAAFALGASGVQMGTAFLSCPEAGTDAPRRARLRRATDSDTMVTDAFSGLSARAMRSRYAQAMEARRERLPAFLQMYTLTDPLVAAGPEDEVSFHLYGQAASLNREVPAADLMHALTREAFATFARVSKPVP
ncbi:nitronate monooxygenase [Tabrizicola sp. WMC-M-20]|nr:nitronate monooxygenase [Tabrizicola sp. WMC-M-20]